MYKGYKVRIFPTPEQEETLWKHVNICRYWYNYMLEYQEINYSNGGQFLRHFDMNYLVKGQREEREWLKEVSTGTLYCVNKQVETAYLKFFKGYSKHPNFKSKKTAKKSYPISLGVHDFYFEKDFVKVCKIGHIKYKTNYKDIPYGMGNKYVNPHISFVHGKWIVSFELKCESQARDLSIHPMGIDLGIKELAVVAYGDEKLVYHNINKSAKMKRLESKKKHIQRVIHRKYRTNGNWDKTSGIIKYEKILKQITERISNIRLNYIHQTTHELISLFPAMVTMENLDITQMEQNKHIATDVFAQCLGEFLRQMEYKCNYNEIPFQKVDRFYPSSKLCSNCGARKKKLKWSVRTYHCQECGISIDRDYNAAINLMRYVSS